jgi:hypothetical protein
MKPIDHWRYELSNGRTVYACCHVLGIAPDDPDFGPTIYEGHDGTIYSSTASGYGPKERAAEWETEQDLTPRSAR